MQVIHPFKKSPMLVKGDDAGGVRVWDERMLGKSSNGNSNLKRPHGCVLSWKENDDYISALEHSDDGHTLLATSADGRLSVFDIRMATSGTNTHQKPFRLSDDQGDELLSVRIMKNGKKVVCGTAEGVLAVFSWGYENYLLYSSERAAVETLRLPDLCLITGFVSLFCLQDLGRCKRQISGSSIFD
jgi:WD40 repeat protein